ncbi:RIP homotypic interaction motif-containing protein [Actinoplanes couchii]|uniref:Uncharacterized protein n=1 Tax=Actinoplanes couchii TaxID=403638 RepID=A0ABQ3XKI2_9ACTN|nr:RIP homotypic interaction motif-containing protein [Actinoplanes couchii]MDR6320602.1 hypothetical protein [Actinoplanes couchii]GID59005.1 hypothetical protein Aco03nite_074090 [Actinoplanes couchii]
MEPVTLIVRALTAVAHGNSGTALRAAVAERFAGTPAATLVLAEHQNDPDTWAKPLAKHLRQLGADTDPHIVALARALQPEGKYDVRITDAKGVQIGDGNTQTNTFS